MSNTNVIDFISHFDKKQRRERVREQLSASGWDVSAATDVLNSDMCVYLMDTKESAVLMYGTSFSKLPNENEVPSVDWQHFVLAWDVIADPEMPFDETHKRATIELSLSVLSSIDNWGICRERLCSEQDKKPHLLVLIDRENMMAPKELIVAYSESQVLNADSLQAIVNQL